MCTHWKGGYQMVVSETKQSRDVLYDVLRKRKAFFLFRSYASIFVVMMMDGRKVTCLYFYI